MENLIIKRFADDNSASPDCTIISANFFDPSRALYSIVEVKNGLASETLGTVASREDLEREQIKIEQKISDLAALKKYLEQWTEPIKE